MEKVPWQGIGLEAPCYESREPRSKHHSQPALAAFPVLRAGMNSCATQSRQPAFPAPCVGAPLIAHQPLRAFLEFPPSFLDNPQQM